MDETASAAIDRAFVEAAALDYEMGRKLHQRLLSSVPEVQVLAPRARVPAAPGCATPAEAYRAAKRTLVVAVRRNLTFQRCRPSADWQLPLVTSCPGLCAYCYLQTTLGPRPYIKAYVNIEEILERADRYAHEAGEADHVTSFEAAATGDPIAIEGLTGLLGRAITHFAARRPSRALLRVVTKFAAIEPLLALDHGGRTRVRFSINTPAVVARWEGGTAPLAARLDAAARLAAAGYPVGLMVAPVLIHESWREDYEALLRTTAGRLGAADIPTGADGKGLTFEVVTHRFTARARDLILSRHAAAGLPMTEEGRRYRIGQFGYGKWTYDAPAMAEVREVMAELVARHFPGASLEYVV